MLKIELESKINNAWVISVLILLLFKEENYVKSHLIKSNHRDPRKKVDTCGALVIAPYYSATVLAAKMCTNSNGHSMYIRFLWLRYNNNYVRAKSHKTFYSCNLLL